LQIEKCKLQIENKFADCELNLREKGRKFQFAICIFQFAIFNFQFLSSLPGL